ncbi:MAG: SDR family oxidoreductase [Burkholderiales bacterium]
MPDLTGKVVLITGASTGIGAAVAKAFGAEGSKVAVHYNSSKAQADDVVASIRKAGGDVITVAGDLSKSGAAESVVKQCIDHYGRVDVLINNAGSMVRRSHVVDSDDALLEELFNLNIRSVVAASRAAIPHMRKQGGGNIIITTSVAARNGGGPGAVLYASTKGFVSTFTRGLAKEVVKDNIRVNAVAPGVILTPFHERYSTKAQLDMLQGTIPMGRLAGSDECNGAYLYLASNALSGYVTGQVMEVNGGQLMP